MVALFHAIVSRFLATKNLFQVQPIVEHLSQTCAKQFQLGFENVFSSERRNSCFGRYKKISGYNPTVSLQTLYTFVLSKRLHGHCSNKWAIQWWASLPFSESWREIFWFIIIRMFINTLFQNIFDSTSKLLVYEVIILHKPVTIYCIKCPWVISIGGHK